MSSVKYLRQLGDRCINIADAVSDSDGFVSVRGLLENFGAKLLVRPLLVEGMLASSELGTQDSGGGGSHQWFLLLDRETHDVSDQEIANERFRSPLSVRFRNTVAHELAHSLAFRSTEFGIELPKRFGSEKSNREFVASIEKETEKLSPLLLLPDRLLDRLFSPTKQKVSVEEICATMRSVGVSRYVFINRLNWLPISDATRIVSRACLNNLAIGIGEWLSEREAAFKGWPFYSRFDGGKVPSFIFQLQKREAVATASIFSAPSFLLCGGSENSVELTVSAGTPKNSNVLKLPIVCSVECVPRKAGSEFLFIIQSRDVANSTP
jgi:hypothetical protein